MPGNQGPNGGAQDNGSQNDGSSNDRGGSDNDFFSPLRGNRRPTAITLSAQTIKENRRRGSRIGELSTEDSDSSRHTYRLISGRSAFTIDGNVLKARRSFDFERQNAYVIRVATTDSSGNTYEQSFVIRVKNVRDGDGGDINRRRQTATDLGVLSTTRQRRDSIGGIEGGDRDRNDYFSVNLAARGSLTVALNRLKADADLRIFNQAGVEIGRSDTNGRQPDSITLNSLEAGLYYIQVLPGSRNARTKYRLVISTVAAPPAPTPAPPVDNNPQPDPTPQDFNGTFTDAMNLGTLPIFDSTSSIFGSDVPTAPLTQAGRIGFNETYGRDANDFFVFNHTTPGSFIVSLSNLTADADLVLYDSSGNILAESILSGTQEEWIWYTNAPTGTYYARVLPYSNAQTGYKLSLIASRGNEDGFASAEYLGVFEGDPLTRGGSIDYVGENEFYRFRVGSFTGNGIFINLYGLSADADIQIFNNAFEPIANLEGVNAGTNSERVFLSTTDGLSAGDTYYVRVRPYSDATTPFIVSVTDA
jgi:hypothetical protein